MLEIKITIEAEGLSRSIDRLADALMAVPVLAETEGGIQQPITEQPVVQQQPVVQPITEQPAVQQQPVNLPVMNQPPFEPSSVQTAPMVTLDALSRAGAALIDQGKIADVLKILGKYGVQALNQLDPSMFAAFADDLRTLGAVI